MSCMIPIDSAAKEIPKYLYRYLSLDGPGLFRAERIILHDEIYLTSPAKVNDPFDCVVALDFEAPDVDWYNFLVELSKRKQPHLLEDVHRNWADDVIKSGRHKETGIQMAILGGLQETVNSVGLLCLTER